LDRTQPVRRAETLYDIKICNIFPTFFPNVGGVETSIFRLSNALAKKYNGTTHYLLTQRFLGTKSYEKYGSLEVFRLTDRPSINIRVIGYGLQLLNKFAFNMLGNYRAMNFTKDVDVFIAHIFDVAYIAYKLANRFKKPWIMYTHGRIGKQTGDSNPSFYEKTLLRNSALILVNRKSSLLPLEQEFGKKVVLLPPYVDTKWFKHPNPKYVGADKNLLFVGSLWERKDPVTPILAVKLIKRRIPEIKLQVVGSGFLEKPLLRLTKRLGIERNVVFHGSVLDVRPYLWSSDIFLATSPYTNYPSQGLLEAMSANLAIIATNVGETPLLVEHLKNGILIPPKNPKELAEAVISLYENEDLMKKISAEARKTVEKYDIEKFSEKYINLLHRVLTK